MPGVTDATGAPITAPCALIQTTPLTDLYASLGVHFSGPGEMLGAAIINECGNFGLPPRSGSNFLAFNTSSYTRLPETIRFDSPQRTVSIFGGDDTATIFTMTAYRGSTVVGRATATNPERAYVELAVTSERGIDRVVVSLSGDIGDFVLDDLTFALLVPRTKSDCTNGRWRTFRRRARPALPQPGPLRAHRVLTAAAAPSQRSTGCERRSLQRRSPAAQPSCAARTFPASVAFGLPAVADVDDEP